jgi:hypothetical protein
LEPACALRSELAKLFEATVTNVGLNVKSYWKAESACPVVGVVVAGPGTALTTVSIVNVLLVAAVTQLSIVASDWLVLPVMLPSMPTNWAPVSGLLSALVGRKPSSSTATAATPASNATSIPHRAIPKLFMIRTPP